MQTFWDRGFEATALPDLLGATGLSRSSLYQAFGNKQRLFERCLLRYQEQLETAMRARLAAAPSGWAFLTGVLDDIVNEKSRTARRRGCLVMNTAREFNCRDRRVSKLVKAGVDRMTAVFATAIRRAQDEGDIPREHDATMLGAYFLAGIGGLRTLLQSRSEAPLLNAVAAQLLQGLRAGSAQVAAPSARAVARRPARHIDRG